MTIVSAHQPAYLPWLGYFHKIALSDIFVVLDQVQFEKNSFINRNKIKGPQGEFWLTVPVSLKGHMQGTINEIRLNNQVPWRKKHLKSIENSYRKAAYFSTYISFFRDCYNREWDSISDLTYYMLSWFLEQLKIDVKIYRMSEISVDAQKTDLVLQISKKFNAAMFVFGALGKGYANETVFAKEDINLYFQDYTHPEYSQLYGEFLAKLSILDLIFNCGPDSTKILLDGNRAKKDLIEALDR